MTLIKRISDFVVKNAIIFLLAIAITHFYISNFVLSVIVAAISTFIISALLKINGTTKEKKKTLTAKNEEIKKNLFYTLTLNTTTINTKLFADAFKALNFETSLEKGILTVQKDIYVQLNLSDGLTSKEDIIKAMHVLTEFNLTKCILICDNISQEAISVIDSLEGYQFQIVDKGDIYEILNKTNLIPQERKLKKDTKNKLTWKKIGYFMFSKKKFKSYVLIGVLMLFSAYIVPYSTYYKVSSVVFFLLAVLCLVVKFKPTADNELIKW